MLNSQYRHPYHLVDESPWPFLSALGAIMLTSGLVDMFASNSKILLSTGGFLLISVMFQWWRDISYEGTFLGLHSSAVQAGLRWGMVLFIISEIFFFISFFWAFFHSTLIPKISLGMMWPPQGVMTLNAFEVPMLNTIILLSSGVSVTWAHHSLMEGDHTSTSNGLMITVCLGFYFTALQGMEYHEASFSISDSALGSTFYMATGFHGFHVLVGTLFLLVCLTRHQKNHYSKSHHFGFEAAVWYWHFVDVVWLFLYLCVYWWGSGL